MSQPPPSLTLSHLASRMLQFHTQINELSKLNKQLSEFNRVFASFLLSLQLTATGVKINRLRPELVIPSSATVDPEIQIQPPEETPTKMAFADDPPPFEQQQTLSSETTKTTKTRRSRIAKSHNIVTPPSSSSSTTTPSVPFSGGKKVLATETIVKKVCLSLPLHMRTPGHLAETEAIIRFLIKSPSGEYGYACDSRYINDILTGSGVEKHRVMQYLNLLIRSNDIVKVSKKVFCVSES